MSTNENTNPTCLRVAIVDDHWHYRDALSIFLGSTGRFTLTLEAENGNDLITRLKFVRKEDLPQVIILDIRLPLMDGFTTATLLQTSFPAIKILAVSIHEDRSTIARIIKCGALGYITKDEEPSEIVTAIETVAAGKRYLSRSVTEAMLEYALSLPSETPRKTTPGNARFRR